MARAPNAYIVCQNQAMREQTRICGFTPEDYDEVVVLWRESGLTIRPSDTLQELKKVLAQAGNVFLVAEGNRRDKPPILSRRQGPRITAQGSAFSLRRG